MSHKNFLRIIERTCKNYMYWLKILFCSYPKEPEKLDVCLLKARIRGEIVQKGSHSVLCQDINVLVALKSTQRNVRIFH